MVEISMKYVGQMIQQVRELRKLEQQELANSIFVSKSVMSKIESGKADINIQNLVNISKVLNVRLEYLLGIDRDMDDDVHLVNLFMKKFFKIVTSGAFFEDNPSVFSSKEFENFFYSVNGDYIVLEGPTNIFILIREIAKANGVEDDIREKRIKEAFQAYIKGQDSDKVSKSFLISKNQLEKLIEEYTKWEIAKIKLDRLTEDKPTEENV